MILQMMGRAGRQQYNTEGSVYIMTKADKKVSEEENNSFLIVRQCERSLFSFIEEQIIALLTFQRRKIVTR